MKPPATIQVGSPAGYEEVYSRGFFAVYRKTLQTITSFVVAKIPGTVRAGDPPAVPTSVCSEFGTEAEATAALNRWADAPEEVLFPKKRKDAIESCRNVVRPKLKKTGPNQLDFSFS